MVPQQQIQKVMDLEDGLQERLARDRRVKELIQELQQYTSKYTSCVYKILNEIYQIRKQQIRGYKINWLIREQGINFTSGQVRRFFCVRFFSNLTQELIQENKISEGFATALIYKNKKFQDHSIQNKVIEAYLSGKLNQDALTVLKANDVMKIVNDKALVRSSRLYILKATRTLKGLISRLRRKKVLFQSNVKEKEYFIQQVEILNKFAKEIQ